MTEQEPTRLGLLAEHWDDSYADGEQGTSWYQDEPVLSLELIEALRPAADASLVDVGGGASRLAGALLGRGYRNVTVLDASDTGMGIARRRLGADADNVSWLRGDALEWTPPAPVDVWHDRAVLHFLTEPAQARVYVEQIKRWVPAGAGVVIGSFAADGPTQCSGLPTVRRDPDDLLALLGSSFSLVQSRFETHTTPSGNSQSFAWIAAHRT